MLDLVGRELVGHVHDVLAGPVRRRRHHGKQHGLAHAGLCDHHAQLTRLSTAATWVTCVDLGRDWIGVHRHRPSLRSVFRVKLVSSRQALLEVKDHLALLSMDVDLRQPKEEEEEIRGWLIP